ncbi:TM2 domain-containing protein [Enterococcus phage phiSHEF13]|uniref:TM2 domain-containing protein n=2 Tax=Schiekvirus TaxID=2732968 RepID=A0A411B7Q5_9CAUD|nr:hypothetical protein EfsSzw1_185 [Enterococcus phage EfsSzw-1]UMO76802.1 TM2 domain-containing protein [Enterococcus phage phiSHEF13]
MGKREERLREIYEEEDRNMRMGSMSNEELQREILREQLRQLKEQNIVESKPNLTVFLLLAFFLGGIGAHKFYTGKIFMGLLYLVFCWTFIPVVLSLLDIVIALINRKNFS